MKLRSRGGEQLFSSWIEEDPIQSRRLADEVSRISEDIREFDNQITSDVRQTLFRRVESLLHEFPVNELARHIAWVAYSKLGESERALEQVAVILALDPGNPNACRMLLTQLRGAGSSALIGAIEMQMRDRATKLGIELDDIYRGHMVGRKEK